MAFEVKLEQFGGPLHLLLEIIESKELPITEVSLATVTDDYLRYLDNNDVPPEELADFLVVATRLLYLKSKAILPVLQLDEEEDASKLELQLKMYKEFADATKYLEERFGVNVMYQRERQKVVQQEGFVAPAEVTPTVLGDSFQRLLRRLRPFFALQETTMERVASIQQRVKEIREAILERSRLSFKEVVRGAKSKSEVVVSFLALLELMKQQIVRAAQNDSFSEIEIKHVD